MGGHFSKAVRIAIDGRMIKPHAMHGIARYVFELTRCFAELQTAHTFFVLVRPNSPLLELSWPEHITLIPTSAPWISFREQWVIPQILRKLKIDLFHSPSFVAPFFCPCKLVMTIHDLNHIMLPQYYTPLHQFYYNTIVRRSMQRSSCLLTVSGFSKREIVTHLGIAPEKIFVTYNGISSNYTPITDPEHLQYVRELYELPPRFLFCLTNNKPHKNVHQLVRAYVYSNVEIPLVLVGTVDTSILRLAEQYGKKHQIYYVRFIEEEHLPAIYSLCHLFVYPSSYEGFGLPPLEALACGSPVAVANASSLPEVVGENAIFINPFDFQSMASTLQRAVEQIHTGNPLREQGIQYARKFSWPAMAKATLSIYEHCVGQT